MHFMVLDYSVAMDNDAAKKCPEEPRTRKTAFQNVGDPKFVGPLFG